MKYNQEPPDITNSSVSRVTVARNILYHFWQSIVDGL